MVKGIIGKKVGMTQLFDVPLPRPFDGLRWRIGTLRGQRSRRRHSGGVILRRWKRKSGRQNFFALWGVL